MKVIVSLRKPVERAFSQWNMRREKGRQPCEFLDARKRDQETDIWRGPRGNAYIARSLYSVQLEKLYNLFPRKQVLVLKYEELRRNPFGAIDRVFDFIGVKRLRNLRNRQRDVGPYPRQLPQEG